MQTDSVVEKRPVMSTWKVRVLGGLSSVSGLVAAASATTDINATISPIITQMVELIPTIINLIIAIVPAILIMSVIGFLVGFFDKILGMMHLR